MARRSWPRRVVAASGRAACVSVPVGCASARDRLAEVIGQGAGRWRGPPVQTPVELSEIDVGHPVVYVKPLGLDPTSTCSLAAARRIAAGGNAGRPATSSGRMTNGALSSEERDARHAARPPSHRGPGPHRRRRTARTSPRPASGKARPTWSRSRSAATPARCSHSSTPPRTPTRTERTASPSGVPSSLTSTA